MSRSKSLELVIYTDLLQPYVRMTQKSMYINKYAKIYLASKAKLKELMLYEIKDKLNYTSTKKAKAGLHTFDVETYYAIPDKTPFRIYATVNYPKGKLKRKQDIDNILKALLDAGNELIYNDDRWCDAAQIDRHETTSDDLKDIEIWMMFAWDRKG